MDGAPVSPREPRLSAARRVSLLAPFIGLAALTAAAAIIAALLDWHRYEMLVVAAVVSCAAALPTLYVLGRQLAERKDAQAALASAQARVSGIVDSAMDAIITVDSRQRVVLFNHAAEAVFGCPRCEAMGAPLETFIPERFRHTHAGQVRRFGETGASSRRMGHGERIVTGLRRNGEEFPIDASISHIVEDGEHLYTVILRDVSERVKAEAALRASREEIRGLALTASTVREQEKSRIARELHDELGQALTALKIDVGWLREHLATAPGAVLAKLEAMQALLDGTVAAARRISSDLRPLMLDDLGLVAACEWLAHNFEQRTGTHCELVVGSGDLDLPDPYATAVFQVLQESLTNVARHAAATQVEATLERSEDAVTLTVRDNGRGFDPAAPRKAGSYGQVGLHERAYLLGGDIAIESAPGHGTQVEMRLPLNANVGAEA